MDSSLLKPEIQARMFSAVDNAAMRTLSRRTFLKTASLATTGIAAAKAWPARFASTDQRPQFLVEFSYSDVALASDLHNKQLEESSSVLMQLSEDSLLKPFRQMVG